MRGGNRGGRVLIASRCGWRSGALAAGLTLALATTALAAEAEDEDQDQPKYPTAEFAEGAKSASVTVGDVTAGVSMVRRPDIDPNGDVPVLQVLVGSVRALETPGVASGMDQPAAEASIAEIDAEQPAPGGLLRELLRRRPLLHPCDDRRGGRARNGSP